MRPAILVNAPPVIILAAGASRRLGRPKQLELLDGIPLLGRAVALAIEAGCRPIVVLGCRADEIRQGCPLADAEIVLNPDWPTGMASSLRTGIEALPPGASGTLVMTCDQPAVTSAHLRALLRQGSREARVIASSYAGRQGVPAYFPVSIFPSLLQLEGDAGARSLLQSAQSIALERGELDIDTEASLQQARLRSSPG